MISLKNVIRAVAAALAILTVALWAACSPAAGEASLLDAAKPIVGTGGHGHTYPGACVPFGMVQLSPDTRIEGWDACSGYHWSDETIFGFSHNHLSGTGAADLGNIMFMPATGAVEAPIDHKDFGCRFSHDQETASPGYYRVVLPGRKITVELTATERCGIHRYHFASAAPAKVIIDLRHGIGTAGPEKATMTVENDHTISGSRCSNGFIKGKTYYFVAEFSQPFKQVEMHKGTRPVPGPTTTDKFVWGAADFGPLPNRALVIKVGISAVSVAGARANLQAEAAGKDFDALWAAARAAWQQQLGRIDAQFADEATRETFYSALYHAHLCPWRFCDVDGSFYGPDFKTHPSEGFWYYTNFSLWDTFRAENPLLIVTVPDRMEDMIKTLMTHYRLLGQHHLPRMPYGGQETWCMIGNHSIPVIAEAYAKGIRGFDANAALDAMIETMKQDRDHLDEFRTMGYIPHDGVWIQGQPNDPHRQCASRTLEYAYNDACVARFAEMLGRAPAAAANAKAAHNWRNVFDAASGFMRGKMRNGNFFEPFDPTLISFIDYTEANAWQYTFFVPHEIPAFIQAMGGDEALVKKLDTLFALPSEMPMSIPDVSGLIGQYAQGNEPCHHIAYMYNYAGQPWKTQQCIHKIMAALYNSTPAGLCGNEDCGQMSAWYVWSALGLYPVDPMTGVYVIGSPVVNSATIHLHSKYAKGEQFRIVAKNNSPQNVYIQSATLNGRPLSRSWISHAELTAGGELVLKMGAQPNVAWGAAPGDRPR